MWSGHHDRGEVSAQVVLVIPVVILILMLAIQSALYFHTSNIAGAAAAQGASAASVAHVSSAAASLSGVLAARTLVSDAGGISPLAPTVFVTSDNVLVSVIVDVPRIVPFFPGNVRRTVVEAREHFTTELSR